MNRRETLLTGIAATLAGGAAQARQTAFEVYKTPDTHCCRTWVNALEEAGLPVISMDLDRETLSTLHHGAGVAPVSCHMAFVEGYVMLGHVPMEDVRRFLADRPDALGLHAPSLARGAAVPIGKTRLILRNGTSVPYPVPG